MRARRGAASIAELILVLWLFAFVLAGIARFASAQSRMAAAQLDRTRADELVRTAWLVLNAELRSTAAADRVSFGADSFRIRAFRGGGRVCRAGGDTLVVAFAGDRLPDPAKDSVLLIGGNGIEEAMDLAGTGLSSLECDGAGRWLRLGRTPGSEPAMALLFESGVYDVAGTALRYRRGAGGRQPLTEPVLANATLGMAGPGPWRLTGAFIRDSVPRLGATGFDLTLSLLNPAPVTP